MRKYSWILWIAIMVLCIGLGILLPRIVFSKTLDKSSKLVEKYKIEPVEMGHSNTVLNAMRACDDSDYILDYQEEMANLSREQLIETCNSFLEELELSEWGYDENSVDETNMKADCYLVVINYDEQYRSKIRDAQSYPKGKYYAEYENEGTDSDENAVISTVIWKVEVESSPDNFLVFAVDDKNQKVIKMYRNLDYAVSYDGEFQDLEHINEYVSTVIIPFFKEYYGVNVEFVESGYQSCIIRVMDNNDDVILLSVFESDGFLDINTFL